MFLRYYLLATIPVKTVLAQTVEFEALSGINSSQIISPFLLLVNIIFIIIYLKEIIDSPIVRSVFIWCLILLFLSSLQPFFSFGFTQRLHDFANFLKLSTWITIIPLAFLAFHDWRYVRQLKISAMCAFFIILLGLAVANVLKIGDSSYRTGLFFFGFWKGAAPLSIAIVFFVPYFFLPSDRRQEPKLFSSATVLLAIITLCVLLLIMKRSSILGFLFCVLAILFLYQKNTVLRFTTRTFIASLIVFALLLSAIGSFVWMTKPDLVEYRFKDMKKYQESGDIGHFGAGRLGLLQYFGSLYLDRPYIQQFCGIDIAGYIDSRRGGYLHTGVGCPPHNDYMEILLRNGLIGLSAYIYFLAISFWKVWTLFRASRDTLTAQVSSLMLGMFPIYFVSSIAGTIFRTLPMTCFAILLGATLGVASRDTTLASQSAPMARH